MHLIFDLHKGRFGMRSSPLFDVTQDLFTLLYPGMFVHRFFHALLFIQDGRIVSAFVSLGYPSALQKCRGHPHCCKLFTDTPTYCVSHMIIWHVIEHDLHHLGELFLTCGMHGLPVPDL